MLKLKVKPIEKIELYAGKSGVSHVTTTKLNYKFKFLVRVKIQ